MVVFLFFITSIFDFGCGLGCAACRGCTFKALSDDPFDKLVLRYYSIPWLEEPEGMTNVKKSKSDGYHYYQAETDDPQNFWDYGEYVYDKLIKKDYTLGAFYEHMSSGELFSYQSWTLVKKPTGFEDCCSQSTDAPTGRIRFYFTTKKLGDFDAEKSGFEMENVVYLTMTLKEHVDRYMFSMKIDTEGDIYMKK